MRNLQYLKTILGAALLLATASAAAQYVWIDEKGARNYSDRPPPPGVPADKILKAPRGMQQIMQVAAPPAPAAVPMKAAPAAAVPAAAAPAAAAPAAAPTAAATLAAREEDYRKRKQASEEKAKKDADAARVASANRQNCDMARAAKAKIESGERLQAANSVNPREVMGDLERSATLARANQAIAACNSN